MDDTDVLRALLGIQITEEREWWRNPDTLLPVLTVVSLITMLTIAITAIFITIQSKNELDSIKALQEDQCQAFADLFVEIGRVHEGVRTSRQPRFLACQDLNPNRVAPRESGADVQTTEPPEDTTTTGTDDRPVAPTDGRPVSEPTRPRPSKPNGDRRDPPNRPRPRPPQEPSPSEGPGVVDTVTDCVLNPLECNL